MLLDFIYRRAYAEQVIQCAVITLDGYGARPGMFGVFFGVVGNTLRVVILGCWTLAVEAACWEVPVEMDWCARHPTRCLTAYTLAFQT
jgi:hypothetical protein